MFEVLILAILTFLALTLDHVFYLENLSFVFTSEMDIYFCFFISSVRFLSVFESALLRDAIVVKRYHDHGKRSRPTELKESSLVAVRTIVLILD